MKIEQIDLLAREVEPIIKINEFGFQIVSLYANVRTTIAQAAGVLVAIFRIHFGARTTAHAVAAFATLRVRLARNCGMGAHVMSTLSTEIHVDSRVVC